MVTAHSAVSRSVERNVGIVDLYYGFIDTTASKWYFTQEPCFEFTAFRKEIGGQGLLYTFYDVKSFIYRLIFDYRKYGAKDFFLD